MKIVSIRSLALGLIAVSLGQLSAAAQTFDAFVENIVVTQGMQTGSTPLTGRRATYVRVITALINPPSVPVALDGVMRVFDGGVEVPESPIFSINGPYPAQLPPNPNLEDGTLNFYYLPPITSSMHFEIEINPAGPNHVPESNTSNNKLATPSMEFFERNIPEFAYVPIDYRPGGTGSANLPDAALIAPGSGDGFIHGIYPASDIDYHRTDAPSKLWTEVISGAQAPENHAANFLASLLVDWGLMVPQPDSVYGWFPGSLSFNGEASGSFVAMGNTQAFKFQRTYAHELGHNFGLNHNSWKINGVGIDVENHLNITETLGTIKLATLNDIMTAGLNTNQAWVRDTNYEHFWNHTKLANLGPPPDSEEQGPGLMITGSWNRVTGEVQLSHVLTVPAGNPTAPVADETAEFVLRAYRGTDLVQVLPIVGSTTRDTCADLAAGDTAAPVTVIGFSAVLPLAGGPIDRLELTPAGDVKAGSITLRRSAAPAVQFNFPGPAGDVSGNGVVTVSWTGTDPDGDPLSYYLRYSHDGTRFAPLATGISGTELQVNLAELPRLRDGQGFFELRASDGLNTTVATSSVLKGSGTFFAQAGAAPWVEVVTPDSGMTYQKGTTVFLHSSGWDLEDRALGDSAIAWSSDLDGALGSGRITSVATLSVGTHVLTATATDSDAMMSMATTTITITSRDLPATGGSVVYCTAGTSASGCTAAISSTGTASATAASGFTLDCASVEGLKDGQFFFGANGQQANTWGSGTSFQCVMPPTKRGGIQTGSGTAGVCDGSFSQDLNARWQAKPGQNPGAGAVVQAQFWYRDPANTSNQTTSLSDAIEFTVQP